MLWSITVRDEVSIHDSADVSPEAILGPGTSVWHQAQIREGAQVGANCIIGKGVYIDFDVTIGANCKLQNGVYVYHPATLEDGVFLGPGVIVTNDKRPRAITPEGQLKSNAEWLAEPVHISYGAAVGAGAILLPGVHVGRWALIGAGSLVSKDVPGYGLVFGNPARLRGYTCPCGHRLMKDRGAIYVCPTCQEKVEIKEHLVDTHS
ncbi:MAG TPA: DapH/DapD/GlmU-related protein [Anaerolineae bacterium]|jgi:acetyltransferase-like isoleucine patch superfamily enzyme|nr:DapH/DapD/GlmU-related protein [Anaerolineae bacterium]